MNEIMVALYDKAKSMANKWKYEKLALTSKNDKIKEFCLRDTPGINVDGVGSPHLVHIEQCVRIIDEIEQNHIG